MVFCGGVNGKSMALVISGWERRNTEVSDNVE